MASSVTYNRAVDKQQVLVFTLKVREGNDFIDISTWQFNFKLINAVNVVIWNILNSDFSRPDIYTVKFQKSVSDLSSVINAPYTISLLVTNSDMINNEIMNGQWNFSS